MVMINQFDLIGDTDIDDPLQIALVQIEILSKKAAAAAAAAKAKAEAAAAAAAADAAAAAAADADLELSVEETVEEAQKGVLSSVPENGVPYQDRRGRGQNGRRRGPGRNFESNRNVDGFSAVPEDSAQDLQGKPSIRRYSDQSYGGRFGGRGRGYLNRDNGEYDGWPARRQYERQSGISSPPAKVKGELSPPVKDVPAPHVELGTTDKLPEQNLEENASSEGKSSVHREPVELDNAPTSNALGKNKEGMANGRQEKVFEPVVKLKTLEEYQKEFEKKRRTLVASAMKTTQERKVDVDKQFESMQQLVVKKENNEFFIKLSNDKEAGKRKEDTVGDERVKKDTVGDDTVKKDTDRVERVKKVFRKFDFSPAVVGRGGRGGQGWRGGRGDQDWRGDQGWRGGRGDQGGRGVQGERGVQGGRGVQGWHGERGVQGEPDIQVGRGVQVGRGGGGQGGRGGRGYSSSFSEESIKDPRQFPELGGKKVEQHRSAQGKKVEQQQQHSSAAQGKKVEQQQQQQHSSAAQGKKVEQQQQQQHSSAAQGKKVEIF